MSTRHLTGAALAIAVAATAVTVAGGSGASAAPGGNAALKAAEQSAAASTGKALGLPADQSLIVRIVLTDPDGTRHVRYDRTVDGLAVVGGDLVVAKSANGTVKDSHWNRGKGVAPASTKATVTKAAATTTAANGAGYRVDSSAAALVVYASEGTPRLAWQVDDDRHPREPDPEPPEDLGRRPHRPGHRARRRPSRRAPATPSTRAASRSTRRLRLELPAEGLGAATSRPTSTAPPSGTGTQFTDADDTWGTGAPSNRQTAAVDAHYGAQQTWDYYKNVLRPQRHLQQRRGRAQPGALRQRLRQRLLGRHCFCMTYGDGAGNAHPLTAIDVAGHEMSHGVTETTAGLNYSGESGGLNEATSDIFGTAVEFYANNAADRAVTTSSARRSTSTATAPRCATWTSRARTARSADCWYPASAGSTCTTPPGPLNHFFYLVSEGSGAKTINGVSYNSPTCNGSTVTGVGRDVAEKVWYRTLTTKLTSSSGYAAARNGAIASAKELYGKNTAQCPRC